MTLQGFAGPLVFLSSTILMFLVVPWRRIKELFVEGAVIGMGVALVLLYLMQNLLGIWIFHRVDMVHIIGIPILLSLAWIPAVIVFSHLLAQYKSVYLAGLTLVAFPLGATVVHWILLDVNLLSYSNWNLVFTFLLSVGIHIGIAAYLLLTQRLK